MGLNKNKLENKRKDGKVHESRDSIVGQVRSSKSDEVKAITSALVPQDDLQPSAKSDDVDENKEQVGHHYQRRKLVSNWQRYEEATANSDDDNVAELRGSDISELLKSSAKVSAYYQFKNSLIDECAASQGQNSIELLSIDCDKLAAVLDCIPLHIKLGLSDASLFEPNSIARYERLADSCRKSLPSDEKETLINLMNPTQSPVQVFEDQCQSSTEPVVDEDEKSDQNKLTIEDSASSVFSSECDTFCALNEGRELNFEEVLQLPDLQDSSKNKDFLEVCVAYDHNNKFVAGPTQSLRNIGPLSDSVSLVELEQDLDSLLDV